MVPRHLPDHDPPRVWARPAQSHRLVSPPARGRAAGGAAPADPGARSRPAPVRVPADLGPVTPGGLAGESKTRASTVPTRGVAAPDARPATQAHRPEPRASAHPGRAPGTVEHGLRA